MESENLMSDLSPNKSRNTAFGAIAPKPCFLHTYLFPPGPVGNINVYHSRLDQLAPVVREAGQQVFLVVRQTVVDKQNGTETETMKKLCYVSKLDY